MVKLALTTAFVCFALLGATTAAPIPTLLGVVKGYVSECIKVSCDCSVPPRPPPEITLQ